MPIYQNDMVHCSQERCTKKDKCYRYWLGKEIKNTQHRLASYYYPSPKKILGDKCDMFLDIKDY